MSRLRTPLLGRFRERWLSGALPLVVEHPPGQAEAICAAPSLWMGARELALALAEQGVQPRDAITIDVPLGIRWVQSCVALLRVGGTLHAADSSEDEPWRLSMEAPRRRAAGQSLPRTTPRHAPLPAEALASQALEVPRRFSEGDLVLCPVLQHPGLLGAPLLSALDAGVELHIVQPGHVPAELSAAGHWLVEPDHHLTR